MALSSIPEPGRFARLVAWGTLGTMGLRVLIIWIYNHTGRSIFPAITLHVTANVGKTVFPGGIAYYDPMGRLWNHCPRGRRGDRTRRRTNPRQTGCQAA
ncbi:MAG: hypothetical protein ABI679_06040 [Gemmatimonadota bacterium]